MPQPKRPTWKGGQVSVGHTLQASVSGRNTKRPDAAQPRPLSGVVPGRIHLWEAGEDKSNDPHLVCLLDEQAPRLIRGLGGWEQLARGGRRAGSRWPGGETPAFEINVLLENEIVYTGDGGTRDKMKALERLCGGPFSGDEAPPVIQWSANVPLHDYATNPRTEWVCESFDYGDIVSDDRSMPLIVPASFVLAVHESAELPTLKRARPFPRRKMNKGESLRTFAKRVLGDAGRWEDILDLNRDDPKVPKSADYKITRAGGLMLAVPPREKKSKRKRK